MLRILADGFGVTALRDRASIESGRAGIGVGLKFGLVVCVGRGVDVNGLRGEGVTEGAAVALAPVTGKPTKSGLPSRYIAAPTPKATRPSPMPHQPTTSR